MWGNEMGEVIGRCVSREAALKTLEQVTFFIPQDRIASYSAALNRVRYEFQRHEPVAIRGIHCGNCGKAVAMVDIYCSNCGREIKRT